MPQPISYSFTRLTRLVPPGDTVQLILGYPLKTIRIHGAWAPLFRRLAEGGPVPLETLAGRMPDASPQKIAGFLNQLVYKGFLERSGNPILDDWPSVSIVIPVRNRPEEIGACIESLQRLDYPAGKVEIVVVDDASDDATPDTVAGYPVRLIRLERHKQASYCRNLGARHATGAILAFIDSDCIADPLWLKQLIPAFADPELGAVGGRVDGYFEEKPLDRYEKAKSSLVVSNRPKHSAADDPFFYVPACNFLVRRSVFLELDGFAVDLTVGEDVDLCWRLQNRGHGLEFRPDGTVFHKHRNDLVAFCRRRFDYGTSEPLLQRLHADRRKKFVAPPAAAVFWGFMLLWVISGFAIFGGAAGLVLIADGLIKWVRFRGQRITLGLVFGATVRSTAAFGYHLCAFVSRYYLIAGLIVFPLVPAASLAVLAMHLLHATVEHRLKKPALGWAGFFLFFTFEQLAYQAGVWWGCIRQRVLLPLVPKLVFKLQ